jgi:Tat protein translocase TatB subunit
MNFFNIGTAELLLIFVIALIVVGPRRLPEIGRSIGKIMNDLRKMSQELTMQMTQELEALPKELEAIPKELEALPKELDALPRENEAKEIADQNGSEKEEKAAGDQG